MKLKEFQLEAVKSLFEAMEGPKRDIVLKSPTGSGKTIILTYFMQQYLESYAKTVFVWLTPGKGSLEEQSKEKMDRYIHGAKTKLLADVMTAGFEENDCCFINWEKLTKKGNTALKDSERLNFTEHIRYALNEGLRFVIIVDESHQNNTVKAEEIIRFFRTDKIIRCSATPKMTTDAELVKIDEGTVINEGLIKKVIFINQDFPQRVETEDKTGFLLDKALEKQRELRAAYRSIGSDVNPLILVQLPNKSEALCEDVERFFEGEGINYGNGRLAVWLSNRHKNLENIEKANAQAEAVIIKQAVATGWDCPRAQILVKLRENMDEIFEIQTIGRIRRMPEAKHYGKEALDSCYLYTFDEKFTEGMKQLLSKSAFEGCTLFLKNEYKDIKLISERYTAIGSGRDPRRVLKSVEEYYRKKYGLSGIDTNRVRLETNEYVFSEEILRRTYSGKTKTIEKFTSRDLNEIAVAEKLNTHRHGREYHRSVAKMGMDIGLEYAYMNTIVRKLFDENSPYAHKLLKLTTREVYAFVLNNTERLRHDIREAMASVTAQGRLNFTEVSGTEFHIPQSCLFSYDGNAKTQRIREKNVYEGYLSSAEYRSGPEKKFEKFCEESDKIKWVYKNGDKGSEYLSIVYEENSGHQRNFFPDYVVGTADGIWIIETKGGFERSGKSDDIDIFSPKKFEALKAYLNRYGLRGGVVRYDEGCEELCICRNEYSDDIKSSSWEILGDVL